VFFLNEFVNHFEDREDFDPSIINTDRDIDHIAGKLSTSTMLRQSQSPMGNTLDLTQFRSRVLPFRGFRALEPGSHEKSVSTSAYRSQPTSIEFICR
jgi:hypothetical protein